MSPLFARLPCRGSFVIVVSVQDFARRRMAELHVLDHPLIQSKLTRLRDVQTDNEAFRQLLDELTALMVYEITRDYPLRERHIVTPLEETVGKGLDGSVVLVPILRAGTGMLGGVLHLIPMAKVGHLGLYRDPATLEPVEYYCKLPPDLPEAHVILVDPMLATGGSAVAATDILKREGAEMIQFLCLVAAPEGVETYASAHPDVPIYTAALDRQLNEKGYILPGLGDAGDRIFGT
jgi:uracil phosphoribosyltransferase